MAESGTTTSHGPIKALLFNLERKRTATLKVAYFSTLYGNLSCACYKF